MQSGVTIIRKKQGMKSLIKKLVELQHFSTTVGIHSGQGRRAVPGKEGSSRLKKQNKIKDAFSKFEKKESDGTKKDKKMRKRKQGFNIAFLAKTLETFATWTQSKNVAVKGVDGEFHYLKAGSKYKRPARHFVSIHRHSEVWSKMQALIRSQVDLVLSSKSARGKSIFNEIGGFASSLQKSLLGSKKLDANGPFATMIKGRNTPLSETNSLLMPAISHKIINDKNKIGKSGKAELKLSDANLVDDLIKKINRK